MLRVIAGAAKRKRLKVPRGLKVRPTSDRVKEALFNILGDLVPGSVFLDLYAGTGNVGIEALSRGAERAVFVEKDRRVVEVLVENLALAGVSARARVMRVSALAAIRKLGSNGEKFDLIFLDPPYSLGAEGKVLNEIAVNALCRQTGLVIVESPKDRELPVVRGLVKVRRERYGDTALTFYRVEREEGGNFADSNLPG